RPSREFHMFSKACLVLKTHMLHKTYLLPKIHTLDTLADITRKLMHDKVSPIPIKTMCMLDNASPLPLKIHKTNTKTLIEVK
ncbi:hypothetical protein BGX26_005587, partial [Mortierella sp. AD094]